MNLQKRAMWAVGLGLLWGVLWIGGVWRLFPQNAHFASGLYAPVMGFFTILASVLSLSVPSGAEANELLLPFVVFWLGMVFFVGMAFLPGKDTSP